MGDDMTEPLTKKELHEAKEAAQQDFDANLIPRGTHGLIDSLADTALHLLDRLAETERERDELRAKFEIADHLSQIDQDAAEAAEARLAASMVLSREDTEKLREALKVAQVWMLKSSDVYPNQQAVLTEARKEVRAALALLDGRKEEQ